MVTINIEIKELGISYSTSSVQKAKRWLDSLCVKYPLYGDEDYHV